MALRLWQTFFFQIWNFYVLVAIFQIILGTCLQFYTILILTCWFDFVLEIFEKFKVAAVKNKWLVVTWYFVISPLCWLPRKQFGTYRDILSKPYCRSHKGLNLPRRWVGEAQFESPFPSRISNDIKKSPSVRRVNMLIVKTQNVTVTKEWNKANSGKYNVYTLQDYSKLWINESSQKWNRTNWLNLDILWNVAVSKLTKW